MSDNELQSAAAKLFAVHSRWQDVGEAEAAGWAPQLWDALQQSGFSDVPVAEELGGAGGSVADAVQLLRAAGSHAAPVPLAEEIVEHQPYAGGLVDGDDGDALSLAAVAADR